MTTPIPAEAKTPIVNACEHFDVPLRLVNAIINVESACDPHRWRVEAHYRYLWDVRANHPFGPLSAEERQLEAAPPRFPWSYDYEESRDNEWRGQQASWGPMQIMGGTAREMGFRDRFPRLCSWDAGVWYGCCYLERLQHRFRKDFAARGWEPIAAAYNAGSPRYLDAGSYENQVYVDKVRAAGGL